MTIKLLLLKSGEDIIANVSEMTVGEEENPRVVKDDITIGGCTETVKYLREQNLV